MANKQANVVYRDQIDTNDVNGTEGVKKACKVFESIMVFMESTKRRDPHAELKEIKYRKTRKANQVEIELIFFVQHRLSLIKLQRADPKFQGYGRWA